MGKYINTVFRYYLNALLYKWEDELMLIVPGGLIKVYWWLD